MLICAEIVKFSGICLEIADSLEKPLLIRFSFSGLLIQSVDSTTLSSKLLTLIMGEERVRFSSLVCYS